MKRTLVLLSVVALFAAPVLAGGAHAHKDAAKATAGDWSPNLVWAGTLMGMDVYNRAGEQLGDVEELVLNHADSSLSYVVLSYGGIAGLGDKLFAVPWAAFHLRDDGKALILNVDKSKLENAPGFNKDQWPNMADASFAKDIHGFYGTKGQKEMKAPTMHGEHWWMRKYSNLIGLDIRNLKGDHLADLENIGIDTKEGRTVYAILSFGGVLGVGESLAAVPWSALEMRPELEAARIDTTREILDAIAFQQGNWPNLADRNFASQLFQRFNRDPYWEVYGYVEGKMTEKRNTTDAWKAGSKFNAAFNAETVVTFEGVIESVGTFHPVEGAAAGYRLRVKRADTNETITVYAGPRSYVNAQGLSYNYGDKLTVTGSKTEWEGRSVILATKIVSGDKTIELRTEAGEPKWKEAEIR